MTNNCQPRLLRFNHLPTLYRQWITTNPFDTLWFRREMDRLFSGPPYVAATEGAASTCSSGATAGSSAASRCLAGWMPSGSMLPARTAC